VADAATEVEYPCRSELGLGKGVGGYVALPGRVEPAFGGDDSLAGELHGRMMSSEVVGLEIGEPEPAIGPES